MRSSTLVRIFTLAIFAVGGPALAGTKTVTLEVPGMTCSACPITVRAALKKVPGVEKVSVSYEPKEAVVTFDDAKTSLAALQEATRNAGYPSMPKTAGGGAK